MKLITMTDFVLKTVQTPNVNEAICWEQTEERLSKIYRYSLFLKQTLKLEMFIPCDEKGNILKGKPLSPNTDSEWIRWENEEFEFYKARDKVLFNGFVSGIFTGSKDNHFEWIDERLLQIRLYTKDVGSEKWVITDNQLKTVEDLIRFGFEIKDDSF